MKKVILFIALSILAGCSFYSINSEEVTENYYPPKNSVDSVVYLEEVKDPHEVIGFVTVNTERRQKMQDVLEKMKREAAVLGGDAITNITRKTSKGGEKMKLAKLKKFFEDGSIRATFTATVISLHEPAVTVNDTTTGKGSAGSPTKDKK